MSQQEGGNMEMSEYTRPDEKSKEVFVKQDGSKPREWLPPSFQDTVEVNGIQQVFLEGSPVPRRVIWTLIVLTGIGFLLYQIVQQIMLYYTWPVTASVNVSAVTEMPFPRIGICNLNRFRLDALPDDADAQTDNLRDVFPQRMLGGDWLGNYMEMAHLQNETLLSCKFAGSPCSATDFVLVPSDGGMCYVFNNDLSIITQHKGRERGLVLELNTQLDKYIMATDALGFTMHANGDLSPLTEGNPLLPGFSTYVELHRAQITNLPEPWESCGEVSLQDFDQYSHASCLVQCETDWLVEQCGCQVLYMNRSGVDVCDPVREIDCATGAMSNYMHLGSPCNIHCPATCKETIYTYQMFQGQFSTSYLQGIARKHGSSVDYWKQNLLRVHIFYRRLVEEIVDHTAVYDELTLLCDLGGALGLFLGASFISVLELIDFLFFHYVWRHPKRPKGNSTV